MIHYDPYSPQAFDDPIPFYKQLRDEAPATSSRSARP